MKRKVYVAGVGMIPFAKPGMSESYDKMGAAATRLALEDAKVDYDKVEQAYASFIYGDTCSGQRALYEVGLSGIPIFNVNNACASGSSAIYLARQAIENGIADIVLAVGFEQMVPGALGAVFNDRPSTAERFIDTTNAVLGDSDLPLALRIFGGAGWDHMQRYGTPLEAFAKVRAKASRHAARNPLAVFRKEVTADEVMADQVIWPGVMTRLMACPPTCGAAAAILCSEEAANKYGLDKRVWIAGQAMTTDAADTFEGGDLRRVVGYGMAQRATNALYEATGIGAEDIDVVELHDCFAHNELVVYEALGLCPEGGAAKFIDDGDNSYGGRYVVNPSGGLLSKGHPIGATGLAQCFELTQQLRGAAEARQVEGARIALQHNLGVGGACVVTMYRN
ncbi:MULTISPECIES: lipid-transfer protein [unclassified Sphingopyxis]|jgi:sterol carrier protein 2|uniref:lipid-transfer protein n=1 Tax=unclassified Sphingopyxis TaxID=2614943 RepID=UPI002864FB3B|nr:MULTISPECIES: lipid-transfer protein [unclassified Sphingopyxis]MDR7060245.1 acetyl-CoA acetyltransferase [Sphingopyxis sp. BE235]MDR7180242.1 acetyl-CoA acetyltransferase [Sphingopyxis sp. BE249]